MGVVGLGVMGGNLARNIDSRGFRVIGHDRDAAKVQAFLAGPAKGTGIGGAASLAELMRALERPRCVLMMVPAGAPVDRVIAEIEPHCEPGDILIDGGNSYFADTDRRSDRLAAATRFTSSAPEYRAASKARSPARPSCRAARSTPGRRSSRSSDRSRRRPTMASPVWRTWGRAGRATT